ncbi:GAS8-like protein, putative [Plasmodium sp. gorilla clade G2]|uniref:GAS8-like protein, putative n=1 Tax=Plasmodium sp. gorilla clade G2 TaxID=880535 RepID=UPI000D21FB3C|nr:GAS8-like protein, putative [Plasmodium sp. gorilla clade G2]SOV17066.1 GAS8-like protein, putative [Plasmodium sp. gorilla clade G2]
MNKKKLKGKKKEAKDKKSNNKLKKLTNGEIENIIKTQKEELIRINQKKHLLEKKLSEKNKEFEIFKNEYKELKNKVNVINEDCEKYDEKIQEENKTIKSKSIFYNFQNEEEMKKLEKEKDNLKILIDEKHEETMNNILNHIEQQRLSLDYEKNKNFEEINELNMSFDVRMQNVEELFTKYLESYDIEKKEEMDDIIENYKILERNEINYIQNMYNDHVKNIKEIHMVVLENYKKYYIDQLKENIKKIKGLKEKINELEINDKEIKNDLNVHNNEYYSMVDNIKNLELKRENLKKDLKFYSKDFVIYKNLELIYNESDVHIKNLKQFSQSSRDKITQVEKELKRISEDELNVDEYFEDIKKQNILLKKKIESIDINLDDINTEFHSYIKEHNIKDEDVQTVRKGINFCLNTYNREFDNLLYTQKKMKKKIKDTVNIYEKKLKDINIKKDTT